MGAGSYFGPSGFIFREYHRPLPVGSVETVLGPNILSLLSVLHQLGGQQSFSQSMLLLGQLLFSSLGFPAQGECDAQFKSFPNQL